MRNLELTVKLYIDNMSDKDWDTAKLTYKERLLHEETDLSFDVWLNDYAHSFLFESGED